MAGSAPPVTGGSALYGVIGDPVAHSLSPAMHNAAYREAGLDALYVPLRVSRERLPAALPLLREIGFRGLNVTLPHKEAVLPFLSSLSPDAARIGSVNTLVATRRGWRGFNTDVAGFRRMLPASLPEPASVCLVGAGGTARAVLQALRGTRLQEVVLYARTRERAARLTRDFGHLKVRGSWHIATTMTELPTGTLASVDLLVQTTPVGMAPRTSRALPFPFAALKKRCWVLDVIYTPFRTEFLRRAAREGLPTAGGLEMFVTQGAESFQLMTGRPAPVATMRRQVLKRLRRSAPNRPLSRQGDRP